VSDDHDEGYAGPATLTVDGRDVPVTVLLDARHEPHDGKLHWFGRLTLAGAVEPAVLTALSSSTSTLELRTAGPGSPARVGDIDPWGRYRVTGVGHPPYPLDNPDLDEG
jgi:hypothetical protein